MKKTVFLKLAVLSISVVTAAGAGCGGDAEGKPGNPPPSATCVVPSSPVDTSSPTTVVGNTGDGLFGGDTGVNLQNTIVANNLRGTLDSTTNCARQHGSSGPNLQFPSGGTQCTSSITVADPALGPLQDNGGPTKTMLPGPGSPAIGKGTGCPQIDQRGNPRPSACTLGAVEAG